MDVFGPAVLALLVAQWLFDRRQPPPESEWADADLDGALAALGPPPDGLSVSIRAYKGPHGKGTRIAVAGVWSRLTMGSERPGDVEIGDPDFDRTFYCLGPRAPLHAAMDAPTRSALLGLARRAAVRAGSLSVAAGVLRIAVYRREPWEDVARAAMQVAVHLREPTSVPAGLAANARDDPQPGVRLASLRTLLREFPEQEEAREPLALAADGPDAELRLEAGRALREEGRPLLRALAADESVDDSCSARAVDYLEDASLEELRDVMAAALVAVPGGGGPRRPHTARACADALGRLGEDVIPLLAQALLSGNDAVALAAIRALERVGRASAVLPLKETAARAKDAVQAAAERAVADIQSRLTGAPGGMSLAAGDTGQVSVVDDPSGRVSVSQGLLEAVPARTREVS